MCGRFDVDISNKEIDRLISQLPPGSPKVKTGEIFPTNTALTLVLANGAPTPEAIAWGFPAWQRKGVIFNARAESALRKRMFRKALETHPLVVPTTGFYEWRHNPTLQRKEKFRFTDPESDVLYLAGFWNDFPDEENPRRFTILTTGASPHIREYHDRMPVLLHRNDIESWLNGSARSELLTRSDFALLATPA